MNAINASEIRATWSPIIESATGINDSEKLAWMSEYCHNHKLYEDANGAVNYMVTGTSMNLQGMGAVSLPNPGDFTTKGSGDKAPTLLPLAMQVAAQTIGLDLVPVIPMAGPMGLLSYLDFTYEGGKLVGTNGGALNAPTYIKVDVLDSQVAAVIAEIQGLTGDAIPAEAGDYGRYELVGTSRLDGKLIFKVSNTALATVALDVAAALDSLTAPATASGIELVKALEDHIPGFSASNVDGDPFTRTGGESTPDNIMGLSLFSKAVEAKTFQVAAAVTREQVQDLKQFGVDAVAQVEAVLTNELTQGINNVIIKNLRALANTNATNAGISLALTINTNSAIGGRTESSEYRKIYTNILAAANLIANRGRRGAGNFAVVGPQVATVLQSVAGYVPNPFANTISQNAGAIYPVGSIAGINIYTDPRMDWADGRVLVGRKGDGNGPGLVFMPYLMAESVQTIAEGTMAPKVAVKSRFALVEAGFHPETMYYSFGLNGATFAAPTMNASLL
jgi:hypothetical protein